MIKQYTTIAIPRYRIEGQNGEFFNVFKKRVNAINYAINIAVEHYGNTFFVKKQVNNKSTIIFKIKIDAEFSINDLKTIYASMISSFQKKQNQIKYWR